MQCLNCIFSRFIHFRSKTAYYIDIPYRSGRCHDKPYYDSALSIGIRIFQIFHQVGNQRLLASGILRHLFYGCKHLASQFSIGWCRFFRFFLQTESEWQHVTHTYRFSLQRARNHIVNRLHHSHGFLIKRWMLASQNLHISYRAVGFNDKTHYDSALNRVSNCFFGIFKLGTDKFEKCGITTGILRHPLNGCEYFFISPVALAFIFLRFRFFRLGNRSTLVFSRRRNHVRRHSIFNSLILEFINHIY